MRKLSLSLENLEVESFHTSPESFRAGTVMAQDSGATCGISCQSTCLQGICTCTGAVTECNRTCLSCPGDCATNEAECVTHAAYPGC